MLCEFYLDKTAQQTKMCFKMEWTAIYLDGATSSSQAAISNEPLAFLQKSSGLQATVIIIIISRQLM